MVNFQSIDRILLISIPSGIVMVVNFDHFDLIVLSMDAIDMSGKHEVDLDTNIWKVR